MGLSWFFVVSAGLGKLRQRQGPDLGILLAIVSGFVTVCCLVSGLVVAIDVVTIFVIPVIVVAVVVGAVIVTVMSFVIVSLPICFWIDRISYIFRGHYYVRINRVDSVPLGIVRGYATGTGECREGN